MALSFRLGSVNVSTNLRKPVNNDLTKFTILFTPIKPIIKI